MRQKDAEARAEYERQKAEAEKRSIEAGKHKNRISRTYYKIFQLANKGFDCRFNVFDKSAETLIGRL